jgi:hypothetical protein
MTSLDELQIALPLFFPAKIDQMTSYSTTLTAKKLIKMRFFTIKIYYISSKNHSQILLIPKFIFGVGATLSIVIISKS